jgi:HAD superfamily hydrolase (TIGR01549 family)
MKVTAVIWDFDGTLADTRARNLNVTRRIVTQLTGRPARAFPALRSLESYDLALRQSINWRDLYIAELRLTESQTDTAGSLWTECQTSDDTPITFYDGIDDVLAALAHLSHGIVSQNSQRQIEVVLRSRELERHFEFIVGHEEVEIRRQKPEPDGLLACVDRLTGLAPGCVFYVGDHHTDIRCASNANALLWKDGAGVRVLSIGALYGSHHDDSAWDVQPDYRATTIGDIVDIVNSVAGADA